MPLHPQLRHHRCSTCGRMRRQIGCRINASLSAQWGQEKAFGSIRYTTAVTMAARSSTVVNSTTTTSMLRRLLPYECRDPPLQLGQLDRLHEHAIPWHFGQAATGQLGDVTGKKEQALGERRAILLQPLV